jgi:hypothetical protein
MPELWLPGAYQDPGVNAYYNAGRSSMQLVVAHFTVGRDSRAEGLRGYFNWLVHRDASRENGCTQYAPTDAVTWHAFGSSAMTDAPTRGPGVEFERMVTGDYNPVTHLYEAEPLTDNQIEWGHRIVEHCKEWGVPDVMYNGPRFQAGSGWHGWINHADIDKDRATWPGVLGGVRSRRPRNRSYCEVQRSAA